MDELYIAITALLASFLLGFIKWLMPEIKEKVPGVVMSFIIVGINYLTQLFGSEIPGLPGTSGSPETWDPTFWTVLAGGLVAMGGREIVQQINKYLSGDKGDTGGCFGLMPLNFLGLRGIGCYDPILTTSLPILLMIGSIGLGCGSLGLSMKPALKSKVTDTQAYLRGSDDRVQVGSGGCYGPVWEIKAGERWIGDVLSVCGLATISTGEVTTDDKGDTGGCFGLMPLNFLGLRGIGCYDPILNDRFFGGAMSFTGLTDQLLK